MSNESGCASIRHTRSVRNDSVYTDGSIPSLDEEYKDPSWHDFVLLASRVRATGDVHYAGHRVNTMLNTGSFNIGKGTSFVVRSLPSDCPSSDASFVAIKIPVASFNTNRNSKLFANQLRAACLELRILSHPPLRSHRNITELLGIAWVRDLSSFHSLEDESFDAWPVLVLEHSINGSLAEMWDKIGTSDDADAVTPLNIRAKLSMCLDVARGLKALHDCDIVHGDMKCDNILLFGDAPNYTAKLADFGHSVTELEEHSGLRANTPPWNAPEDNGDLNFVGLKAADIYSLGFILWMILADGQHPFIDPETESMLDDAAIETLKQESELWDVAHKRLAKKIDFFEWIILSKPVHAILFSSLHKNPLFRSLRNVVNCLGDLAEFDFEEPVRRMLENLIVLPDGQVGIDMRAALAKDEQVDTMPGELVGDAADPEPNVDPESELKAPLRTRGTVFGKKIETEEDEQEIVRFQKEIEARKRGFPYPVQDDDSEVHIPKMMVYTYPETTPEEARAKRLARRSNGELLAKDRKAVTLPQSEFHFSGEIYSLYPFERKANKVFRVDGISPFDPAIISLTTRIQREHPGASVHFETDSLELPDDQLALDRTGRSRVKITAVVDCATEVLRLLARNGGYVDEDQRDAFNNADVLPHTEYLSPNLSSTTEYADFLRALESPTFRVRRFLVDSLIRAHVGASQQEQRKIARTLFVYFLEVDYNPHEALRWLLSSAESGDTIAQPIVCRMYTALETAIPEQVPVTEWLWQGALRGSPVALDDLKILDPARYVGAKQTLNRKYGGTGIDILQGFEATVLGLAAEVIRVAELQEQGHYDGPGNPSAHLDWAREVMEGLRMLHDHTSNSGTGTCWEPEWECQPDESKKPWRKYSEDPEAALRDTFRIEHDMVYYVSAIGDTVLHYAASRGFLKLLEFLCTTYEPPLTIMNICAETPLLQACRVGHGKVANFLLDQGARPNFPSRRGESALHWIFNIEPELMRSLSQRLMSGGQSPGDVASYPNELHLASGTETQVGAHVETSSALCWSILRGDDSVLACVLGEDYGKTPEENECVWSAIDCASRYCQPRCLATLLHAARRYDGDDLDSDKLYNYVRSAVTGRAFDGLLSRLLRHGKNWIMAFEQTISLLKEAGAIPCSGQDGPKDGLESVMVLAMTTALPEMVKSLLQTGWDQELAIVGPQHQPPIAFAAIEGRKEVFKSILSYEDPKILPRKFPILSDGHNVYHWIAKSTNPNLLIADRLFSLGVEYHENSLKSPFELAVRNGEFQLADFFLRRCGADLERMITYGCEIDFAKSTFDRDVALTLLGCLLSEHSNYLCPAIQYLLHRGASSLVNRDEDFNVFHISAVGGAYDYNTDATELLLPKLIQAFPDKRLLLRPCKVRELTPLQWAVRRGNSSAVRIFTRASGLSSENRAFEAAGREAWWWARDMLAQVQRMIEHSKRNDPKIREFRGRLENSIALLQQSGFVSEEDEKELHVRVFWWRWLERSFHDPDPDVKVMQILALPWMLAAEGLSLGDGIWEDGEDGAADEAGGLEDT